MSHSVEELFKVVFIEIFKYSSSDNVEFTHNANALDRVQTTNSSNTLPITASYNDTLIVILLLIEYRLLLQLLLLLLLLIKH
jgi:hypothetical protein